MRACEIFKRKSHNTHWPSSTLAKKTELDKHLCTQKRDEDWVTKKKKNTERDSNSLSLSLSVSLSLFWRLGFKSQTTETTRSCQFLVSSLGSVVVMLLLLFCSEVAS
jgi:hypothetical protein